MATLLKDQATVWPAELAEYDPVCWPSRPAWHLERARRAPTPLDCLNEIRASVGVPPLGAWPQSLTGVREQLNRRGGQLT